MKDTEREKILFSCVGSSDPVRGLHDGSMLHIVRHYKPHRILLYMTKEMRFAAEQDNRYLLAIESLKQQDTRYKPEILPFYYDDREDASDFDAFYEPFSEVLRKLSGDYPEAEILINLSSGTPQMKMTLALLAESLQYRVKVIQVKNFEQRSGTSERTTDPAYDLEAQLELNEDAEEGAPNRCSEPKLIGIQRENQRKMVETLLHRYDYAALLRQRLPERIRPLIRHLDFRAQYDFDKAIEKSKDYPEMELYPASHKNSSTYKKYQKLSEYLLVLQLMQRTQRYTDLVIRLNPFVIRLQEDWLRAKGVDINLLGEKENGIFKFKREKVGQNAPELLDILNEKYPGGFRDSVPNISLLNCLMEQVAAAEDRDALDLLQNLETLNYRARNDSAHTLTNVRDEEITSIAGCSSGKLICKLKQMLQMIYPQHYKEELFAIYDTANKRIRDSL